MRRGSRTSAWAARRDRIPERRPLRRLTAVAAPEGAAPVAVVAVVVRRRAAEAARRQSPGRRPAQDQEHLVFQRVMEAAGVRVAAAARRQADPLGRAERRAAVGAAVEAAAAAAVPAT